MSGTAAPDFFQAIVELHPDLVFVLDERTAVRYASPTTLARLGVGPGKALGGYLVERAHPDDRDAFRSAVERVLDGRGQGLGGVEVRVRHEGGWYLDLEVMLRRFRHDTVPDGVLLTGRDRTRSAALMEAFEASQSALQAMEEDRVQSSRLAELGRLVSSVAHDFNNLVHAARANADLLSEVLPARPELEEIRGVCDRARSLTASLLDLSRRHMVRRETVDVGSAVEKLGGVLRRLMGARVQLRIDVAPGRHLARVDRGHLDQVLLNLVVNARDALDAEDGGFIRVSVESGPARDPDTAGWVTLQVADDGPGIPPAIRERIFEPFFTTKASRGGTGIGLGTVRRLVEDAGGSVELETEEGEGSIFRVHLPGGECDAPADPAREPAGAEDEPAERRRDLPLRILLVEDDPAIQRVVARILQRAGHRVDAHPSWQDVPAGDAESADLVVCDVNLAGTDGVDGAARVLRSAPRLPVIFTSGSAAPPALERRLPNPTAFLPKPFEGEELLDLQTQLVAGRS